MGGSLANRKEDWIIFELVRGFRVVMFLDPPWFALVLPRWLYFGSVFVIKFSVCVN